MRRGLSSELFFFGGRWDGVRDGLWRKTQNRGRKLKKGRGGRKEKGGSFSLGRGSTGEEKRSNLLADFNWRGVFQENCKRRAREESLRFDYFAP